MVRIAPVQSWMVAAPVNVTPPESHPSDALTLFAPETPPTQNCGGDAVVVVVA
jgi:hypothetical protein